MKPEIKLAIEVLEAAGHTVTLKQEPEPEKFVPFVGQIVQSKNRFVYVFDSVRSDGQFESKNGDLFLTCEPIPGLVQFRPMSELDPKYDGMINLLYANGKTFSVTHVSNMFNDIDWVPIGFQLLEE